MQPPTTGTTRSLAPGVAGLVERLAAIEPAAAAEPERVRVVRAPGRVNLMGDHTDYNEGFVLPAAIDRGITIALVPTDDRRITLTLDDGGDRGAFDLDAIGSRQGRWIDYVAGTAWALAEAGVPLRGFRGLLASDLPSGSGLSSSAALELASAWALSGGDAPAIDGIDVARAAQRAENEYVGVNTGLMDQFAVVFGVAGHALLLDCRTLRHRPIRLPSDVRMVVCHSGSRRRLESSEYNRRRAECDRAVEVLQVIDPAIRSLRDVTMEQLEAVGDRLDDVAVRRAEHVVGENARVLDTIVAIEAGDLAAVGRLFAASHGSLRDRFEVSSPELDALVEIAKAVPGVIGARLTGAGFGGCTINLVTPDAVDPLRNAVFLDYPRRTGLTPRVFEVVAASGAGVVH